MHIQYFIYMLEWIDSQKVVRKADDDNGKFAIKFIFCWTGIIKAGAHLVS